MCFLLRGSQVVRAFYFPDSIEFYKVGLNRNVGKVCGQQLSGAEKLTAVMRGFGLLVAFEMGQAAVGGAIGVAHDHDAFRLVQQDGHADLLQDEVPFEVVAWGSERLGASGDNDHVGAFDALFLQKFAHGGADAMVETAEDGGVGYVSGGGRVEMEDFAHVHFSI
jgi:hypothetical protein